MRCQAIAVYKAHTSGQFSIANLPNHPRLLLGGEKKLNILEEKHAQEL